MIRRRELITLLGGAAAACPLAARAQQLELRTVGYLSSRAADVEDEFLAAFRRGLSETGYVEGRNLIVEYRWTEGRYDQLPAFAAELVRRQVSVIATTGGSQTARAVLAATSTIPVVFTSGTDPVKDGLVKSLNRPGGNATGSHVFTASLGPKRLELLRELVPKTGTVGFLVNPNSQIAELQVKEILDAARTFGQQVYVVHANKPEELEQVFQRLVQRGAGGLLMSADLFFQVQRDQLVALAARHSLPVMYEWPEFVKAGGLISYSTFRIDAFVQSGVYVGRILNGAKPADLPVVQSTRFELTINLKTAKALGLEVPLHLQQLADEIIE
jgi:putative tryptophan/tyrosine transport system substrate-binding protein